MILLSPRGTFVRIDSHRTGQTLLELRFIDDSMIIFGDAPRDRFLLERNDAGVVTLVGGLHDRLGLALHAGEFGVEFAAAVRIETGPIPDEPLIWDRGARAAVGASR